MHSFTINSLGVTKGEFPDNVSVNSLRYKEMNFLVLGREFLDVHKEEEALLSEKGHFLLKEKMDTFH